MFVWRVCSLTSVWQGDFRLQFHLSWGFSSCPRKCQCIYESIKELQTDVKYFQLFPSHSWNCSAYSWNKSFKYLCLSSRSSPSPVCIPLHNPFLLLMHWVIMCNLLMFLSFPSASIILTSAESCKLSVDLWVKCKAIALLKTF